VASVGPASAIAASVDPALTIAASIGPALTIAASVDPALTIAASIGPALTIVASVGPASAIAASVDPALTIAASVDPALTIAASIGPDFVVRGACAAEFWMPALPVAAPEFRRALSHSAPSPIFQSESFSLHTDLLLGVPATPSGWIKHPFDSDSKHLGISPRPFSAVSRPLENSGGPVPHTYLQSCSYDYEHLLPTDSGRALVP
jgi:hypothetical protein